jgi:hypothetical protein
LKKHFGQSTKRSVQALDSYDFSAKLPQRREMMQTWTDWLDNLTVQ